MARWLGLGDHLQALLDAQPPYFLHEEEDLVPPALDVASDLIQLQCCKILHGDQTFRCHAIYSFPLVKSGYV